MAPANDFEREVLRFMARIDEHLAIQTARCNSHALDIRAVEARTTSLEATRTYACGMVALGTKIGLAAVGISGMVYGWISAFGLDFKGGR